MRIIYRTEDGKVAILVPTDEALSFATIEQIAEKDVPAPHEYATTWDEDDNPLTFETYYTPYWVVSIDDISSDRALRDEWELDPDWRAPDGYGGESNEFGGTK